MPPTATTGSRRFAWQAAFILLPLLVLAGVGVFSLRQDRALARLAAVERAEGLADHLAARIWTEIQQAAAQSPIAFSVDPQGRLAHPAPFSSDDLLATLPSIPEEAISSSPHSLPENPSSPLASGSAGELFQQALALAEKGDAPAAMAAFAEVARRFPSARGETGLPLSPLAQFKYLELSLTAETTAPPASPTGITLASFCSNIVTHPNLLSPLLLEKVAILAARVDPASHRTFGPDDLKAIQHWQGAWANDEQARRVYSLARERLGDLGQIDAIAGIHHRPIGSSRSAGGLSQTNAIYLIRTREEETNRWFHLVTSRDIGPPIKRILEQTSVPAFFGISLRLAGEVVLWLDAVVPDPGEPARPGNGGRHARFCDPASGEILASATSPGQPFGGSRITPGSANHDPSLLVSVHLVDPSGLYAQQQSRTLWFGLVIALSAGAALLGLAGAWRSFRRQEQLNAMKSNFVSSVSHELRAPIASLRLMAENLERDKIPEEARRREYFHFINQECCRLSALIENVLDFSRIEQGRKQYEFEPCDLAAVVRSTARLMEPAAAERGITLRLILPPAAKAVHRSVDGKALQQALVNLVDNALKHSPRDSVVTLGLETPGPEGHLCLYVEDHGIGIPQAEHQRIFERFYRVGSELRRETQGVGIGLSIVKHIAEAHGGHVLVRSAPGQGSRFTIQLPNEAA